MLVIYLYDKERETWWPLIYLGLLPEKCKLDVCLLWPWTSLPKVAQTSLETKLLLGALQILKGCWMSFVAFFSNSVCWCSLVINNFSKKQSLSTNPPLACAVSSLCFWGSGPVSFQLDVEPLRCNQKILWYPLANFLRKQQPPLIEVKRRIFVQKSHPGRLSDSGALILLLLQSTVIQPVQLF